jgi:hypothetical protein
MKMNRDLYAPSNIKMNKFKLYPFAIGIIGLLGLVIQYIPIKQAVNHILKE